MSLSTFAPRLTSRFSRSIIILRNAHSSKEAPKDFKSDPECPPPSTIQMTMPKNIKGHFQYERFERARWDPKFKNNEWMALLFKELPHDFVIQALWGLGALWLVGFCYIVYISFDKIEIWLDRRSNEFGELPNSFDWTRVRNNYWKKTTVLYDTSGGGMNQRLPIMEQLQDTMLEESIKRKKEGNLPDHRY